MIIISADDSTYAIARIADEKSGRPGGCPVHADPVESGIICAGEGGSRLAEADPGGFQELVNEAGVLRRRLYYLGKVGRALAAASLSDEMLGGIGWTKLSVIADHLTTENATELIAFARTSTVVQLRQAIGRGTGRKIKHLLLRLEVGDYDRVVSALTQHGATIQKNGLKNAGSALVALIETLR